MLPSPTTRSVQQPTAEYRKQTYRAAHPMPLVQGVIEMGVAAKVGAIGGEVAESEICGCIKLHTSRGSHEICHVDVVAVAVAVNNKSLSRRVESHS